MPLSILTLVSGTGTGTHTGTMSIRSLSPITLG